MLMSPQSAREGAQCQVSEQGQTSDRISALLAQCSLYCPKQPEFLALSPWRQGEKVPPLSPEGSFRSLCEKMGISVGCEEMRSSLAES